MTAEEHETHLQKAQRMQDRLVNFSTNGGFDGGVDAYRKLRGELLAVAGIDDLLPSFVKRHRDLGAYWQFIKREFKHYAKRRDFLWDKKVGVVGYHDRDIERTAMGIMSASVSRGLHPSPFLPS